MLPSSFDKDEIYQLTCDRAAAYYLCIALDPRDKMYYVIKSGDAVVSRCPIALRIVFFSLSKIGKHHGCTCRKDGFSKERPMLW